MGHQRDKPNRREQLLRDYRRRLTRLEIQRHRLKAVLARLEADRQDEQADLLTDQLAQQADASGPHDDSKPLGGAPTASPLPRPGGDPSTPRAAGPAAAPLTKTTSSTPPPGAEDGNAGPHFLVTPPADEILPQVGPSPQPCPPPAELEIADEVLDEAPQPLPLPSDRELGEALTAPDGPGSQGQQRGIWERVRNAPAWVTSVAFHLGLLLLLGLATFATWQDERPILAASLAQAAEELVEEIGEVEIQPLELEVPDPFDSAVEPDALVSDALDLPDLSPAGESLDAAMVGSDLDDLLSGDFAQQGAGALGSGGAGSGGGGQKSGRAKFFGAQAQGDRFVFVVDNSRSMVDGRMETALLELTRSVEALTPKQFFYVILYSDKAYALFHPQPADQLLPATPENKQRLRNWITTVQLCYGGRVLDAIELAASLEPQAVFLLSDGLIGASAMQSLIGPHERKFVLHTLGMTVPNAEAATNLSAIARAHRGTFRSVMVAPLAAQMARRRPLKKNPQGAGWAE